MKVRIPSIDIVLPKKSYSISEFVDDLFKDRLDKDVREFFKNDLGIERVYKSYDFGADPYSPERVDRMVDMYVSSAENTLRDSGKSVDDLGLLVTVNDNTQLLDPAPTVEVVSRLGLRKDIRTQNLQGMACSALCETLRNAAGHKALGYSGDTLVLGGSYYTDWFLPREDGRKVSLKDKKAMNDFAYFLVFSDSVGSALVSADDIDTKKPSVEIDLGMMSSRKDNSPRGHEKAYIELEKSFYGLVPEMSVDSKILRETVSLLSKENLDYLKSRFPEEYESVKVWNLHTAGKKFVDHVKSYCGIDDKRSELTYDLMRRTGNTGAVSSLQLIKESVDRGLLSLGDFGGMIDYGWEGADAFLYKRA